MIEESGKALLRRLIDARERRDLDKTALSASEAEFREIEADVFELLRSSGIVSTLKLDLGDPYGTVAFLPRETTYGRIIDEDLAIKYYKSRAKLEEYTEIKFGSARINEDVRKALEAGESPPPGVDFTKRRGVTITRK